MAYTIIEVERATNIPSRKIRFWLDKGLFPLWNAMKMGCVTLQKAIWSG
ncbi:MerR family transcriptional regulator [Campylobacter upsaliensis]